MFPSILNSPGISGSEEILNSLSFGLLLKVIITVDSRGALRLLFSGIVETTFSKDLLVFVDSKNGVGVGLLEKGTKLEDGLIIARDVGMISIASKSPNIIFLFIVLTTLI